MSAKPTGLASAGGAADPPLHRSNRQWRSGLVWNLVTAAAGQRYGLVPRIRHRKTFPVESISCSRLKAVAQDKPMIPGNFFGELKRRNVYKVAVAYAVVSWLLIQIATQVFPFFEIPNWAVRLVIVLLILGFPVALILSWAFDITPEGIKRTDDILPQQAGPSAVPEKSIAVLPFENLSDDQQNTYFADGIQDD